MRLPFTEEQFLGVFARYNEAIWPMQIVAYVLAVAAVALAVRPRVWASRIVAVVLALMWLWTGWEYHIVYFAPINPAAKAFGALFILEGLAFLATAAARPLTFGVGADLFGVVGGAMILYAMVIYPMLGAALGRAFPESPSFGVTPCPVTIFTFGMLLWARETRWYLVVIPFAWSAIGFMAAVHLGVVEDTALLVVGLVGTVMLAVRGRRG